MDIAGVKTRIGDLTTKVKAVYPDAWVMLVITEFGHLQLSVNRPKSWPIETWDIYCDDDEWPEKLALSLEACVQVIDDLKETPDDTP